MRTLVVREIHVLHRSERNCYRLGTGPTGAMLLELAQSLTPRRRTRARRGEGATAPCARLTTFVADDHDWSTRRRVTSAEILRKASLFQ